MKKKLSDSNALWAVISIGAAVLIWQAVSSSGLIPKFMLPPPIVVLKAFFDDFDVLMHHASTTLSEAGAGIAISIVIGFFSAVFMDTRPMLKKILYPLLVLSQTVPAIAIAPLLVLWFGFGMTPKIILIVLVCFFPITVGFLDGFATAGEDEIRLLKSMGANEIQVFKYLKFPSSFPHFFAGLKVSASYCIVSAVISEWLGGTEGLGVYMTRARKSYAFDRMFAVIILISALSIVLMFTVERLRAAAMPYERKRADSSIPILTAILVFLLLLSGCSGKDTLSPASDVPGNTDLKKITVVLDWTPNTNHTGMFVALDKGFYKDAGLYVNIVQPPEEGAAVLVAAGRAEFGVEFQDYLAPAFAMEDPLPVTAVAALVQHNTSGILSPKSANIKGPKDLEGKRYATWDLPVEKAMLKTCMENSGGDFSKLNLIPSTVTDVITAISTDIDAVWVFYGWDAIACEVAGVDFNFFAFKDEENAFDYYTPVLIASDSFLNAEPDIAKAFLKATETGYAYTIESPEEAADILLKYAPELDVEIVKSSQRWLSDLYKAEAEYWGEFDKERWNAFYEYLWEKGLIDYEIPNDFGFTNEYLNGYGNS